MKSFFAEKLRERTTVTNRENTKVEVREGEEKGDDFESKNLMFNAKVKTWVNDDPYHANKAFKSKITQRIVRLFLLLLLTIFPMFWLFIYPAFLMSSYRHRLTATEASAL